MFYGLNINDSWFVCDPSQRFSPSCGSISDQDIFEALLEEHLQDYDGHCSLPWDEVSAWTFWKGNSKTDILEGKGELIKTLHGGNKEAWWELRNWLNGSCITIRVYADY